MTLTLLIDLDDTLLDNDFDRFLPAYLKELGRHLSQYIQPERMIPELLSATKAMVNNQSVDLTLEEAFDRVFYPAVGQTKRELHPVLDEFYEKIFPQLQSLTSPRPDAIQMVKSALADGHRIVIATNPLFPRSAILHRIKWAGLASFEANFDLITTYVRFHFAKPNPTYLAEILAQMGWPRQPAVMIGNSLSDDILPAIELGLPCFLVTKTPGEAPIDLPDNVTVGTLSEVIGWTKSIEMPLDSQQTVSPPALLALIKSTPAALDTICRQLTPEQWHQRKSPDQWNLIEILCHMRDVDLEINLPRFKRIIAEDNPFVPGTNPDTWVEERNYQDQNGPDALHNFIQTRGQMISMLTSLIPEDWHRPARHAIFGPTNLAELVSFVTTHDCSHIQDIKSTMEVALDQSVNGS